MAIPYPPRVHHIHRPSQSHHFLSSAFFHQYKILILRQSSISNQLFKNCEKKIERSKQPVVPVIVMESDRKLLRFEETELRLGLPGKTDRVGKRAFAETVDLNLNLTFSKQSLIDEIEKLKEKKSFIAPRPPLPDPPAKAQVVGWPPVRSFRKNMVTASQAQKKDESSESSSMVPTGAVYVKVSMDGAPYLRKVDLKMYKSYQDLSDALVKMFKSFIAGNSGSQSQRTKDFMNEKKSVDLLNGSEYVSTFEDKDGDWMLVGDVPWEMFVDSCKRLRIMKGSDAVGLGDVK